MTSPASRPSFRQDFVSVAGIGAENGEAVKGRVRGVSFTKLKPPSKQSVWIFVGGA